LQEIDKHFSKRGEIWRGRGRRRHEGIDISYTISIPESTWS
jgi:hypothetical protein